MSEQILSISDAQKEFTRLPDQFEQESDAITVTRYGKPIMKILPFEAYTNLLESYTNLREEYKHSQEVIKELQGKMASLEETLEIVQDEEAMEAFRESIEDIKAGRTIPWEEVKKELVGHEAVEN
jgi:PHD/YefM family antitoxin component YafN of YafNO toxin-antitoxin module